MEYNIVKIDDSCDDKYFHIIITFFLKNSIIFFLAIYTSDRQLFGPYGPLNS